MTRPPKPINTLLVASRGEIARRIFRACREMGVTSVAVYSDVDAGSVWSRKADRSYPLPGVTATETYLDIDAILHAARQVGADAIHPGYGFLSENAEFATACRNQGITFIGPPAEAMRTMGSKVEARAVARAVGVPVVPGFDGRADAAELARHAERIGYPLLIKASAGGGGRGMRLVRESGDFAAALEAAQTEAASSFGDDSVYLERYFEHARHVEVQVLGDSYGNLVHLFERECSVQRRNQKIIEESPSPASSGTLRAEMTRAALELARAVGYTSAGTVEFLLDQDGSYYFLEMNTRLQVEHPVTEMVTGVDIAVTQIQLAAGERMPFRQQDLRQQGHAVECRVYAEDPAEGFAPSTGAIVHYRAPAGPGVRCDDAITTGSIVSPYYDALLAKVITQGWDRNEALRRMSQALSDTVVLGVCTNIPYLQAIIRHPAFVAGDFDTRFIEDHMAGWSPGVELSEDEWLAAAAYEAIAAGIAKPVRDSYQYPNGFTDPWSVTEAWRNVP